jgi:hypothetical protein
MSTFKNWTDYHHRLNLIFHAIVAVTMLPFVWLFLEIDTDRRSGAMTDPVLIGLFIAICTSLTVTAFIYKKKQITEAINQSTLRQKMIVYQRVLVVNYLLLEGAAIFATLAFYLTANYLFAVIYIFILFVFSLGRPHLDKACRDLYLNMSEREILIEREEIEA